MTARRKRKTAKAAPKRRRSRVNNRRDVGEALVLSAAADITKALGIAKSRAKLLDPQQITTLQRVALLFKIAF